MLELCRLLNQRIKDPVYYVTPKFLRNAWNSYSYEFTACLYEFCEQMAPIRCCTITGTVDSRDLLADDREPVRQADS